MLDSLKLFILARLYFKITNVNNANGKNTKRALLSYSVLHFRKGEKKFIHPNTIESRIILQVLTEKGYKIDVYNNTYTGKVNFSRYNLVLGEGIPMYTFHKSATNPECKAVYYATGSHPFYQSEQSVKALCRFKNGKKRVVMSSLRVIPVEWGIGASLADKCIIIGNETTKKTFIDQSCANVVTIEPPFFSCNIVSAKYTESRKRKFLWFGSFGYLHKGLDIVLDFFCRRNDLELFVCGYSDKEKDFWNSYIVDGPLPDNVHDCGFVDIRSEDFRELLNDCGAVVLMSASEGCSTALLTVMGNGGLVPIATKSCGIDIEGFGFSVENHTVEALDKAIDAYLRTNTNVLDSYSDTAFRYVNETYTEKNFHDKLSIYLE